MSAASVTVLLRADASLFDAAMATLHAAERTTERRYAVRLALRSLGRANTHFTVAERRGDLQAVCTALGEWRVQKAYAALGGTGDLFAPEPDLRAIHAAASSP